MFTKTREFLIVAQNHRDDFFGFWGKIPTVPDFFFGTKFFFLWPFFNPPTFQHKQGVPIPATYENIYGRIKTVLNFDSKQTHLAFPGEYW